MKRIRFITFFVCSILFLGVIFGNLNKIYTLTHVYNWIEQTYLLNSFEKNSNSSQNGENILNELLQFFKTNVSIQSYAIPSSTTRKSQEQLLARAIHGEARGEPYEGQVAVGAVILNRTRDSRFPHTVAGVIYQPGAFTAVSDGQINIPLQAGSPVVKAARDALNGWDPSGGCVYYWNPSTATSKWIWSRKIVKKIGKHYFGK